MQINRRFWALEAPRHSRGRLCIFHRDFECILAFAARIPCNTKDRCHDKIQSVRVAPSTLFAEPCFNF